jgi:DEAD/DEAH box helicase domain-containing protein
MFSVRLMRGSPPPTSSHGVCLATVERLDGSTSSWGICDQRNSLPDANWGLIGPRPLLCGDSAKPDACPLVMDEAASVPAGIKVISVTSELDGPGAGFGQRFWSLLGLDEPHNIVPTGSTVVGVRYEDRYLATPVSLGLLLEVISALKAACDRADCWRETASIQILTASVENTARVTTWGDRWGSDWPKDDVRSAAAREGFAFAGMSAEIKTLPKYQLIHGRRLSVHFSDQSTFVIWLDQGFSYWGVDPKISRTPANFFSTSVDASEAGRRIAEFAVPVCGHELSTQVFAPTR